MPVLASVPLSGTKITGWWHRRRLSFFSPERGGSRKRSDASGQPCVGKARMQCSRSQGCQSVM